MVNTLPCQGRDRGFEPRHFRKFTHPVDDIVNGMCLCLRGVFPLYHIERVKVGGVGVGRHRMYPIIADRI